MIIGGMDEKRNTGYDLLIVTGPTASGKTALAVNVAGKLNGEIISADSRQVYRKMDIGTGKDYSDYVVDGRQVPYHLIDIADPGYKYNVFEYQHDFLRVYSELNDRNIFPVVCGGSGMYIDSIVAGYRMIEVPPDPELRAKLEGKTMEELSSILSCYRPLHNKTDIDTRKRVIRAIEIGIFSAVNPETRSAFPKLRCLVTGVRYERETQRQIGRAHV